VYRPVLVHYIALVAQTPDGAILVAAKHLGTTPDEYRAHIAKGEKWCTGCKDWHPRGDFGSDASRVDGLATICLEGKRAKQKAAYVPLGRTSRLGTFLAPSRSGDKKQARRRANHAVANGRLAPPNALPCFDCGHRWKPGERRHEYDHHLGYAAEHQLDVQAVCTTCHVTRAQKRGER
jgi:hypothetical protein